MPGTAETLPSAAETLPGAAEMLPGASEQPIGKAAASHLDALQSRSQGVVRVPISPQGPRYQTLGDRVGWPSQSNRSVAPENRYDPKDDINRARSRRSDSEIPPSSRTRLLLPPPSSGHHADAVSGSYSTPRPGHPIEHGLSMPLPRIPRPITYADSEHLIDNADPAPIPIQRSDRPVETAASRRLRNVAHASLREAKSRYDRGAVYTAHQMTVQALRQLVESRDLMGGGSRHASHLTAAMSAIREAKDFSGAYGLRDVATISRMISIHETPTLKHVPVGQIASFKATEIYLTYAKDELVAALATYPEAADALILLGRIERRLGDERDLYRGAVSLAMHVAATEIRPGDARVRRELGVTLMRQGLDMPAIGELRRSLSMAPTRKGLRSLQVAASRTGDGQTVAECQARLQQNDLPSELPILHMTPQAFAASYQTSGLRSSASPSVPANATPTATSTTGPKSNTNNDRGWMSWLRRKQTAGSQ